MNSKKKADKLIQYLKKWCSNTNNDLRVNWEKQLRKACAQPTKQALAVGSMQLWYWANWHAQHGLWSILNGDQTGWGLLELSMRYRWWKMCIDPVMTQVAEPALLLIHVIALGDQQKAVWLAKYQLNSLTNNLFNVWKFSTVALFGLQLWAKETETSAELATVVAVPNAPGTGVYGAIFQHWGDDKELANDISRACDYHLEQALTQEGYPEFAMSPYNLLPIEYLALRQVRASVGMTTPILEHPLLRSEFLVPPETWNCSVVAPDPEVARLVETAEVKTVGDAH